VNGEIPPKSSCEVAKDSTDARLKFARLLMEDGSLELAEYHLSLIRTDDRPIPEVDDLLKRLRKLRSR
jgi:hypothetical protein